MPILRLLSPGPFLKKCFVLTQSTADSLTSAGEQKSSSPRSFQSVITKSYGFVSRRLGSSAMPDVVLSGKQSTEPSEIIRSAESMVVFSLVSQRWLRVWERNPAQYLPKFLWLNVNAALFVLAWTRMDSQGYCGGSDSGSGRYLTVVGLLLLFFLFDCFSCLVWAGVCHINWHADVWSSSGSGWTLCISFVGILVSSQCSFQSILFGLFFVHKYNKIIALTDCSFSFLILQNRRKGFQRKDAFSC